MKLTIKKGRKKIHYDIPKHWDELNLGRYMRIMKVLKVEEENEIDKIVKILNCITDIPKKDIYSLDMSSINSLGLHLSSFLTSKPNEELKHFIEIEGKEYGFHPCLKEMTLGEFVDLETYMKDINENLHKILSILYRPVIAKDGDKYRIEDYEPNKERAELFKKNLTVGDFHGASVFFYDLGTQLLINSTKCSIAKMKKKKSSELA